MRTLPRLLVVALTAAILPASLSAQSKAPADGNVVLQRMFDAYKGAWYKTLTFTQRTTARRADGTEQVTIWLESLRYTPQTGVQLRIDVGDLANGRGIFYTADSSWNIQNGAVVRARPDGNQFLPLIEGVYVQPVAKTAAELTHHGIDLSKVYATTFDGTPSWIVGASTAADSMSSQFTIDTVRKVITRMVIGRGAGEPPYDVRLTEYKKIGKAWLATRVVMSANGVPVQTEEYTDWKTDIELSATLFDLTQWKTAPHWGKKN